MTVSVTIDGLVFSGDGTDVDWIYEHLKGWYSGPAMRGETDELPNGDGASGLDKAYRSARVLTFTGTIAASSVEEAIANWMSFAAIQSNGEPIVIEVTDPFGTLSVLATLNGTPEVIEITNEGAEVTATFLAFDPVKYAEPRVVTVGLASGAGGLEYNLGAPSGALYYGANGTLGRVTIANEGTASVWPVLTVTGGLTLGFYAQRIDTGEVIRYDRVIPAGSTVEIDFRTGAVVVDGESDGSTYLTRYEFFSVAPGESFEVQFNAIGGSSGTPQMAISVADGYW